MLLRLSCVITISRNVIFTHHVAKYFVTILYTSSIKLCVTHSFLSNDRVSVLIAVFVFYVYFVVGYEIGVLFSCKTNLIARGGFLTLLFYYGVSFSIATYFHVARPSFFGKTYAITFLATKGFCFTASCGCGSEFFFQGNHRSRLQKDPLFGLPVCIG